MDVVVVRDVVRLDHPEDVTSFRVVVEDGTETQVHQALAHVGRLVDRDTAWIRSDAVERLAEGRVDEGWAAAFAGMIEFAAGKGWMSEDGAEIQAHVEWR